MTGHDADEPAAVTSKHVLAYYRERYAAAVRQAAERSPGAGAAAFCVLIKQARRDLEDLAP